MKKYLLMLLMVFMVSMSAFSQNLYVKATGVKTYQLDGEKYSYVGQKPIDVEFYIYDDGVDMLLNGKDFYTNTIEDIHIDDDGSTFHLVILLDNYGDFDEELLLNIDTSKIGYVYKLKGIMIVFTGVILQEVWSRPTTRGWKNVQ
jgi:hypothetical protein